MKDLPSFRLPVGEEVPDIDVGFQLGSLVFGQLPVIGAHIEFFNPDKVAFRKIKCQNSLSESRRHSMGGQVENPPEDIRVRFIRKGRDRHCNSIVRLGIYDDLVVD